MFRRKESEKSPRLKEPVCTYCGGTDFLEGPSGGMSTNILCANQECRHWFNYSGVFDLEDLNRIEPAKEKSWDDKLSEIFALGRTVYAEPQRSLQLALHEFKFRHPAEREHLVAGFIAEMADDIRRSKV